MSHSLYESLWVFLFVGIASVFVFKRLRFGSILGYLVAGAALGPWGAAFITDYHSIMQVAELGIIFFLFLVGLELSPKRLWVMRQLVFVLGTSQLLVVGLAMAVVMSFLCSHASLQSTLAMGLALALSSTAVAMQILTEKRELTTEFGQKTFGILLFQDLAVIPLLILFPLLASGGAQIDFHSGLIATLKGLGAIALLIPLGIYVIPALFRYLAKAQMQELLTAASLFIVLTLAVLMQFVGLSMALGAFLGGVLLANSNYRHELQADVEPFKGLLLGLFFVSVGVSIDFGVLLNRPFLVLGLTALFMVVKVILNWISLKIPQRCLRSRSDVLTAILLGQGSEFAFVLFTLGTQLGLFQPSETSVAILVVSLSMALSPLLNGAGNALVNSIAKRKDTRTFDAEVDHNRVILAGYGRVGQIVHRILRLQNINCTVLESDVEQVDFVRKYGVQVFFGDASRLDLLKTAGAHSAQMIIVTIDDPKSSIHTVETVLKNFPHLKIFARVRNREHALKLMELGIPQHHLVRETFHSSLYLTEEILRQMGLSFSAASETVQRFQEHDEQVLSQQKQYLNNEDEMIKFTLKSAEELRKIFEQDKPMEKVAS